jgi:repressor LexA
MKPIVLGDTQRRICDFIASEIASGRSSPTLREVARHFGFASSRAAAWHINNLVALGVLDHQPNKARSLRVRLPGAKPRRSTFEIPLFGSIPAGMPRECQQQADGYVSADSGTLGFKPTGNTFALRVRGDSMTGKHILNGDIVVLEFGQQPASGQVVAALIDGESTLKTFLVKGGKPYLRAENPAYPDLLPAQELTVQGVFKALIRKAG